jgi:hypothetical protein
MAPPLPLSDTSTPPYPPPPTAAPTGLVLVLAKLCVHMETTTVPHVVEVLAASAQGAAAFSDGPPRFVGGEVARQLGSTASELSIDLLDSTCSVGALCG